MGETADLFADKCYPRFPGAPSTPAFPALNVRLSDVNAALASVQLKRLPGWIARRQAFGGAFCEGIQDIPGLKPHPKPRRTLPSFWWAVCVVDREVLGVDAAAFCEMLRAEGIPASVPGRYVLEWELFRRLDRDPNAFQSYRPGRLKKGSFPLDTAPNARTATERIVAIQVSQHNTVSEARAAARAVRKVVGVLLGRRI